MVFSEKAKKLREINPFKKRLGGERNCLAKESDTSVLERPLRRMSEPTCRPQGEKILTA
jgi:hypothetical protein